MGTGAVRRYFLSYRRDDSKDVTLHLWEWLVRQVGSHSVFLDADGITPGIDYRDRIEDELNRCDVLLAVIGRNWLNIAHADGPKKGQRRLDDPDDYVRFEIGTALRRGIPVVPVLVGDASRPTQDDLPTELSDLAYRETTELQSRTDFGDQVSRLIQRLERECFQSLKSQVENDFQQAGELAIQDPKWAFALAADVLERILTDVYERWFNEPAAGRSLEKLIDRLIQAERFPSDIVLATTLRTLGETANRLRGKSIASRRVHEALGQLSIVTNWYFATQGQDHPRRQQPPSASKTPEDAYLPQDDPRSAIHVKVVPKGLRSFDQHDSRFFLELLPGVRDEHGLPEALGFWKDRIEERDNSTFAVGVIFGPSGCGKTSFVKAGLLPRLNSDILPVYVDARAEGTEAQLLASLRKLGTGVSHDGDLAGTILSLRQGIGLQEGERVLIVLDQFEQWLHANRQTGDPELSRALRQCDGERVRTILMVRRGCEFLDGSFAVYEGVAHRSRAGEERR